MEPVKISLPLKSEYVMIARLAAAGYCTRAGLDIEKTEDIKVIISEVLNKCVINSAGGSENISVEFDKDNGYLTVAFELKDIKKAFKTGDDDDFGISIISALCGEMSFDGDELLLLKFSL